MKKFGFRLSGIVQTLISIMIDSMDYLESFGNQFIIFSKQTYIIMSPPTWCVNCCLSFIQLQKRSASSILKGRSAQNGYVGQIKGRSVDFNVMR